MTGEEEKELERLYALFQDDLNKRKKENEEMRGILGIRWPGDVGLVSRVAQIEKEQIASMYQLRIMRGLFYVTVVTQFILVLLVAMLLVKL